jgi:exosome complex component RRP40
VGIIEDKGGDFYRVNILSGSAAMLNRLNFEGASKRNKPELRVGDIVYCKVSLAHKHLDTELTCISTSGIKKGWSSGEAVSEKMM